MLQVLHTVSGWLILIAFSAKIMLHYWLIKRLFPSLSLLAVALAPSLIVGKCNLDVPPKYQLHKNICNLCWYVCLVALASNMVIGILQLVSFNK